MSPLGSEILPEIPGYEILSELGRGGMGVVYKARQPSHNRLVALKMILSGRGLDFFGWARFRIEAEAVACLQHQNIIRIHDVGLHGGFPYLVLEFAEGGSLSKLIRENSHTPRWAAEVVQSLATAIQHAHDRGILHRDLKPANVLLMADGTPKISDFGLAKFDRPMREVREACCTMMMGSVLDDRLFRYSQQYSHERPHPDQSFEDYVVERTWQEYMRSTPTEKYPRELARIKEFATEANRQAQSEPPNDLSILLADLTEHGTIVGSPHYMAPEQATGDSRNIGPAADIYGLRAVLYYLLAGRPPFEGSDLRQVLVSVQREPPRPIEPKVNRDLELICLKCLEKESSSRYADAAALAHDLTRFLDGYAIRGSSDLFDERRHPTSKDSSPQVSSSTQRFSSGSADPCETVSYEPKRWWQFWR